MKKIIIVLSFLFIIIFLYIGPFNNFIGFFSKDDAKKALNSIEEIAEGVETYIIDWGFSPKVESIDSLNSILLKTYDKKIPVKDPWGNKIIYKKISDDGYKIIVIGKDGKISTIDDLVYMDGKFKYDPKNNKYTSILKEK
jgi:hypothetical protein